MTTKSPFDGKDLKDLALNDLPQDEWLYVSIVRTSQITDIRITKSAARYDRFKRFRNWLHHRAPWLPSWVTG